MGGTPVTSGGGEKIHPAFASLNYVAELEKWLLPTRPCSKRREIFTERQHKWWWLHFWPQNKKLGLLKTLGF